MIYLLNWADLHPGAGQWMSVCVSFLVLSFAIWIGFIQHNINKKLVAIEDSVEVYGYPVYNNNVVQCLRMTNVGKIQVYLQSYQINGLKTDVTSHLIPVNQQQNAWYDILLPAVELSKDKIVMIISLEDQLRRKWTSQIDMSKFENGWVTSVSRIKKV